MYRSDYFRILEVGEKLLASELGFTKTATTAEENYAADITATTTANTTFLIEVKTVNNDNPYSWKHSKFKVDDEVLGKHSQLLNKSTKNNFGKSKFQKFVDGELNALIYYHTPTGKMWYLDGKDVVGDAYRGDGYLYQEHGKEIPDDSRSWETKAIIDLDKATLITN